MEYLKTMAEGNETTYGYFGQGQGRQPLPQISVGTNFTSFLAQAQLK